MVGSGINPWLTIEAATPSSFHIFSMTIGVAVYQIGCREQSLIGGWFTMSSFEFEFDKRERSHVKAYTNP